MISRRDDASHDDRVDEAACDGTSCLREDDREGAGAGGFGVQVGVGVGNVEADDEDREDIEN